MLATALWGPNDSDRFADRWWWNDEVPHCWIAEHVPSKSVAAICAQRRVRFHTAEGERPAAVVSDWYVAPDHAGAGLGRDLVRQGEAADGFMYTSAISDQAALGFGRLGWVGDRRFPMSAGPVALVRSLAGRPERDLELEKRTITAGDTGDLSPLDELWQQVRWPEAAMMVRDAAQLRGHLALAGGRAYRLLIARRRDRVVGYLLFRTLPSHSFNAFGAARVGIVSDYLVDRDDTATLRHLVAAACRDWRDERVVVMLALCGDDRHRATLSRMGLLHPISFRGRMIGARMTNRSMHRPAAGTDDGWHLTFADNDTDLLLGGTPSHLS